MQIEPTCMMRWYINRLQIPLGIGPFLVNFSENFILMEFVRFQYCNWYGSKKAANDRILKCAASILQQCFVLDCLKLDHGQLNRLDRHIIVSKKGNRQFWI